MQHSCLLRLLVYRQCRSLNKALAASDYSTSIWPEEEKSAQISSEESMEGIPVIDMDPFVADTVALSSETFVANHFVGDLAALEAFTIQRVRWIQ